MFLLRAMHGSSYQPPASTNIFAGEPVAGKVSMQPWVEEFYREGITTGCAANPLRYCPEDQVMKKRLAGLTGSPRSGRHREVGRCRLARHRR